MPPIKHLKMPFPTCQLNVSSLQHSPSRIRKTKHPRLYLGNPDSNETHVKGQAATQMLKWYSFVTDGVIVRLIDTPGLGDPRGMDQDKKNVDNILRYLAHFKDLHGIAILMKPNSARLTVVFDFCLKELLRYLHRDVQNNIMFVFTNARGTFYKPGGTYAAVLAANPSIRIQLSEDNIYCMDNEPVRFLGAYNNGVEFTDREKGLFSESGDTACEETVRLIQHVRSVLNDTESFKIIPIA